MNTLTSHTDTHGIATITINVKHESVNVLNQQVLAEFAQLIKNINQDDAIKAVIFTSGKPDCFIGGADIGMLQNTQTAEEASAIVSEAHTLLLSISQSSTPFIAAIDGVCLGAGYELALACDYRIASNNRKTKIGLPEVMLGLLPGATGTSKLPRLISLPAALDLLLTGKQLDAKRALRLGMVDQVVAPTILLSSAKKIATALIAGTAPNGQPHRKKSFTQKLLSLPIISHFILYKAKQQVLKKTRGLYPAPLAILSVIQYGLHKPLKTALAYEAKKFGELCVSPQAKQLITLYFASTQLKKEPFVNASINPTNINHIGILGGGLMGAGIAIVSIDKANALVRMKDIHTTGIHSAYQSIHRYFARRIKRKILSLEQAKKKTNQFTGALDYSGFANSELIIEAVFEDLSVKQQMVADIEALGNENTIFASNTSSIPIKDIAANALRPENIIGMHYFSPVEKMPLLEIIKHAGTSEQTIATAVHVGRQQGKTVIVVNDGAGFYVNRILAPYMNAAMQLGMEGVPFDVIDQALTDAGFPVGPFKLLDEVGIDVGSKILPILEAAFGERMKSCGIQQRLLDKGRVGKKVGKGFYNYPQKKPKEIDASVYSDLNIHPTTVMDAPTIVQRCVYPMLNEAALCLQENIIDCARDGDMGAIFGIGFPPFLGGPFRYMESLGMDHIVSQLNKLAETHGEAYLPAELLVKMHQQQTVFYPPSVG